MSKTLSYSIKAALTHAFPSKQQDGYRIVYDQMATYQELSPTKLKGSIKQAYAFGLVNESSALVIGSRQPL
ncbi:hypothetical protein MUP77_00425 [Candidatus Bathyarchaeota archaeon]|nr:hypothetical protein [Candidatus Bathyarchaeota archaeon]